MDIYALEPLIAQTRQLAAAYYLATRQTLPVSNEIAKFDACRLLHLQDCQRTLAGVDAIDQHNCRYQVKSRVVFEEKKSTHRIGQLNLEGEWDKTLLVLLDKNYDPYEIHAVSREEIETAIADDKHNPARAKRGAMSVAKFKAIGQLVWTRENGIEAQ